MVRLKRRHLAFGGVEHDAGRFRSPGANFPVRARYAEIAPGPRGSEILVLDA